MSVQISDINICFRFAISRFEDFLANILSNIIDVKSITDCSAITVCRSGCGGGCRCLCRGGWSWIKFIWSISSTWRMEVPSWYSLKVFRLSKLPQNCPEIRGNIPFYSEFLVKFDTFTSKSVLVQRNVPKDKVSVTMTVNEWPLKCIL